MNTIVTVMKVITTLKERCAFSSIQEDQQGGQCTLGDFSIDSLLFADRQYVVLLASSQCDLQHALRRFTVACETTRIKVSTSCLDGMVITDLLSLSAHMKAMTEQD